MCSFENRLLNTRAAQYRQQSQLDELLVLITMSEVDENNQTLATAMHE